MFDPLHQYFNINKERPSLTSKSSSKPLLAQSKSCYHLKLLSQIGYNKTHAMRSHARSPARLMQTLPPHAHHLLGLFASSSIWMHQLCLSWHKFLYDYPDNFCSHLSLGVQVPLTTDLAGSLHPSLKLPEHGSSIT